MSQKNAVPAPIHTVLNQKRYSVMPSMDRPAWSAIDASEGMMADMVADTPTKFGERCGKCSRSEAFGLVAAAGSKTTKSKINRYFLLFLRDQTARGRRIGRHRVRPRLSEPAMRTLQSADLVESEIDGHRPHLMRTRASRDEIKGETA